MQMLRAAAVLAIGTLSAACVPMMPPPSNRMMPAPVRVDPVGRWDAVLALDPAVLVGVLTADGVTHTGRVSRAGLYWMRLVEKGAEVEFPRDEVVRVDLLPGSRTGEVAGQTVKGAAAGAVIAGATEAFFAAVFTGRLRMPAGRTVALGAAGGAVGGFAQGLAGQNDRTIYVSPQLEGR
jgi:hypothetical protein